MRRTLRAVAAAVALLMPAAVALAATPAAGPPFPPPMEDVVVYDYAGIFRPETEAAATRTIAAIEERVGAEVAVYTQYKPGSTTSSTEADARALIDQWGIGRAGFDDGLVIMYNMTRRACQAGVPGNGQVQLFAGEGYAATFLSNAERQQIFDEEMAPLLRACNLDGALLVALARIDANATPEHARFLAAARIADAAIGLIGAPLAFLLLVGIAGRAWLRYGRDPVYLDSPSILMPAPPPDLTAASGVVVWDGKATRRALTVALLDLASRGELSFRPERRFLTEKAGIQLESGQTEDPYVIRNRRRPISSAERLLLEKLRGLASHKGADSYLDPRELEGLAASVGTFNERLEKHVAGEGWFREPPHKAVTRWSGRGSLAAVAGIVTVVLATNLPSIGLALFGGALVAAGVAIVVIARVMPARTMAGAMVYAMLAAYRRTLHKTMEQARSMQQVVEDAGLDWLETPDQAVVWGVALGLHDEVERVLERSVEDVRGGVVAGGYVPGWYGSSSVGAGPSGSRGLAPGLFSSGGVPNFGGMMAALGSIGSVSSTASGGRSGGFGGGSSGGGGGGGAGGGF